MWYPDCKKELREMFLSWLLELVRDEKITVWIDEDETGNLYYDIREREL